MRESLRRCSQCIQHFSCHSSHFAMKRCLCTGVGRGRGVAGVWRVTPHHSDCVVLLVCFKKKRKPFVCKSVEAPVLSWFSHLYLSPWHSAAHWTPPPLLIQSGKNTYLRKMSHLLLDKKRHFVLPSTLVYFKLLWVEHRKTMRGWRDNKLLAALLSGNWKRYCLRLTSHCVN